MRYSNEYHIIEHIITVYRCIAWKENVIYVHILHKVKWHIKSFFYNIVENHLYIKL